MNTYLETDESSYMSGMLDDLKDFNNVLTWAEKGRCGIADHFGGYRIVDHVDGDILKDREISFISVLPDNNLPQHVHENSDAYFVIVSGTAKINLGTESINAKTGSRINVPRGVPHGFEVGVDGLEFISVQSPPIKDRVTGKIDFK